MRCVPMAGHAWWEGDAVSSGSFLILVMAAFFSLYTLKSMNHWQRDACFESFISAYLCRLFPSALDALLSQLLSAGTLNSWCLNRWSRALGRREGGESDFLLVNLFFPLCPGRFLPPLCVSRACFPPRSFSSRFFQTAEHLGDQTPSLSLLQ